MDAAPWETLAAAEQAALEANRSGDPVRQREAAEAWLLARERCGLLGGLLLVLALEHAGTAALAKLDEAFGDLSREAFAVAAAASKRVDWVLARLDAAEQRIRELERRLDDRTPGVGRPGL